MKKSILTVLTLLLMFLPLAGGSVFAKGDSDRGKPTIARVDEVAADKITVTLGDFNKEDKDSENTDSENKDSGDNQDKKNPTEDFVAGTEQLTLTLGSDEIKEETKDLKNGDIVFIEYNDENELERIDTVDEQVKNRDDRDNIDKDQQRDNTNGNARENGRKMGRIDDKKASPTDFSIFSFLRALLF